MHKDELIVQESKEYVAGWNAHYFAGSLVQDCPYPEGSVAEVDWKLGVIDCIESYGE